MRRLRIATLLLPVLLAGCANGSSATFDFYLGLTLATVNQIAIVELPTMADEDLAAHRVTVAQWGVRVGMLQSSLQTHLVAVDAEIAIRESAVSVRHAWRCSSILCSTGVEVCPECRARLAASDDLGTGPGSESWRRAHGGG